MAHLCRHLKFVTLMIAMSVDPFKNVLRRFWWENVKARAMFPQPIPRENRHINIDAEISLRFPVRGDIGKVIDFEESFPEENWKVDRIRSFCETEFHHTSFCATCHKKCPGGECVKHPSTVQEAKRILSVCEETIAERKRQDRGKNRKFYLKSIREREKILRQNELP